MKCKLSSKVETEIRVIISFIPLHSICFCLPIIKNMDKKENIIPNKRKRMMSSDSTNLTCSGSKTSISVLNIVDLCDDCVLEIFEYLNLFDWSSMAGTCKRFKQIASNLFIKKFQHFDIDKVKRHSPSLVNNDTINLEVLNGILREFGPLIKDFSVRLMQNEGKNCSEMTAKSVAKYCGGALSLSHLEIDSESFAIFDLFSKRINSLRLKGCKLDPSMVLKQYPNNKSLHLRDMEISNVIFFNQCNQLKQLNLTSVELNAEIWNQHFPKLKHINLTSLSVNVEEVTNFFRKNPQLKHIDICHCKNLDESTLVSISKYLPTVTSLSWISNKIDPPIELWQMPKLNHLETLSLRCKGFEMGLLLNTLVAEYNFLYKLKFEECIFDYEFAASVAKLRYLKELTLLNCSGFSNYKMDTLFSQLKHLDRFYLSTNKHTIRDMHHPLRSICYVKNLTVKIRHEDTINIDEYKMWMTEIQHRGQYGSLWLNVSNTHKYRWIGKELKLFKEKNIKKYYNFDVTIISDYLQ